MIMNSYQLVAHLLNTAHGVVIHAIETFRYQSLVEGWVGVAFALLSILGGIFMAVSMWVASKKGAEEPVILTFFTIAFIGLLVGLLEMKQSIPKILNPDFYIYEKVLLK